MTGTDDSDPPPLIDFDHAHLSWITRDGSHGRWRLIAAATRRSASGATERCVLAPLIAAGDVYGGGRLPLDPPYSFQILATTDRHAIVRDFPSGAPRTDSADDNAAIFSALTIHAPPLHGRQLDHAITPQSIANDWPLTARARVDARDGARWWLDFPVLHVNAKQAVAGDAFQVETGPILVPQAVIADAALAIGGFALGFVFFNRRNRLDLALWGPLAGTGAARRGYGHFDRLDPAGIVLYAAERRRAPSA